MGSDPVVLAFDTSAAHCAAALLCGDQVVTRCELMGRGQAERLMPLIDALLRSQSVALGDLDRIGVGVGPGNFTGIRISVAAARGLALALDVPAIGVSGLQALRFAGGCARVAVAAPRDMAYFQEGRAAPGMMPADQVPDGTIWAGEPGPMVAAMARLAAAAPDGAGAAAPLYLRAADAAPSRDAPPVMLDDA